MAGLIKSKLTKSQHIDKCKPSNPLNKKWGDQNPPQTTQLNKKMKKEEIGNTVNNNNPQAGERRRRERFCSRSDRVDDEGEKEELLGKYLNILT